MEWCALAGSCGQVVRVQAIQWLSSGIPSGLPADIGTAYTPCTMLSPLQYLPVFSYKRVLRPLTASSRQLD
jgi:hypothetical protein